MIGRIFSFVFNRTTLVLVGLVAISLIVWFVGPAVSIGSMGSIRGQELGLGSGIVNMARQVGFAIGVALFVAVFTGAAQAGAGHAELRDAYADTFRVGAFVVLLAIPFSLTMRRKPSDVQREQAPEAREAAVVAAAG